MQIKWLIKNDLQRLNFVAIHPVFVVVMRYLSQYNDLLLHQQHIYKE